MRRVDEDRWLATRFAPADVRARLVALYAVNYEIARISESVREPGLGAIRLRWWSDALLGASADASAVHPALQALQQSGASHVAALLAAEARVADFEAAPFATWDALEAYVDRTSGALMHAALRACGVGDLTGQQDQFIGLASLAWAYAGLLRSAPVWAARGRSFLPAGATDAEMLARAHAAYGEAKALARVMPAPAFPAFGYVALLPGYLRALSRGVRDRPLFKRQLSLIAASATGRI